MIPRESTAKMANVKLLPWEGQTVQTGSWALESRQAGIPGNPEEELGITGGALPAGQRFLFPLMKSKLAASQLRVHSHAASQPFPDPIYGHTIAKH